jgi:hypothetical protein
VSQFVCDTDCTYYSHINHGEDAQHYKFNDSHKRSFILVTEDEYVGVASKSYQLVQQYLPTAPTAFVTAICRQFVEVH